jgi:hypothetical protein
LTGRSGRATLDGWPRSCWPVERARFARAPYAGTLARGAPGAPGANTARSARGVVGDLRYDRSPGLDFSDLPLDRAAPCPKRVPPWIPPRSDLFGPLE